MEAHALQVQSRTDTGKGAARRLRASGQVPAVLYGLGRPTESLSLLPAELTKALSTSFRRNVLFQFDVHGSSELAMLKDLVVHPTKRTIVHADLLRVTEETSITAKIPLQTVGRAAGVQKGGKLTVHFRDLLVQTTPNHIPESVVVDVSKLDLGGEVTVGDLPALEGVTFRLPPSTKIISIGGEHKSKEASDDDAAPAKA